MLQGNQPCKTCQVSTVRALFVLWSLLVRKIERYGRYDGIESDVHGKEVGKREKCGLWCRRLGRVAALRNPIQRHLHDSSELARHGCRCPVTPPALLQIQKMRPLFFTILHEAGVRVHHKSAKGKQRCATH